MLRPELRDQGASFRALRRDLRGAQPLVVGVGGALPVDEELRFRGRSRVRRRNGSIGVIGGGGVVAAVRVGGGIGLFGLASSNSNSTAPPPEHGPDDVIHLSALGIDLPVNEIYEPLLVLGGPTRDARPDEKPRFARV